MRLSVPALLALAMAATTPALADVDSVTYAGTLGKLPIIVELVASPAQPYGRYAYLAKGVDIPLHGLDPDGGAGLQLQEEKPCTHKTCMGADDVPVSADQTQFAAEWTLDGKVGDARLSGRWRDLESGKSFAVDLALEGHRSIAEQEGDIFSALNPLYNNTGQSGAPPVVTPASLPYDFLKIALPTKPGKPEPIGEGVVRMDTDNRVAMDYPTVVSLGGANPAALNTYLTQRRLQAELAAFSCLSNAYLGFGWNGSEGPGTNGYDGNWTVTVDHLTPRLMSLTESGSYYCGGAHPHNFGDHHLADARTGAALVPEMLLRGWIATDDNGAEVDRNAPGADDLRFGPSADLVAYVIAHRQKFDADTEAGCEIDTLIPEYLGVYVQQDSLVFTLNGLPHVNFACTDDLLEVPLNNARPLLTKEAIGYFPALD